MATESIGLYVHIPFCKSKCRYCDFVSFSNVNSTEREKYVKRLIEEIESYSAPKKSLDTIFFGGGTPSLLTAHEIEKITSAIYKTFDISSGCEFSVEINPKTVDSEKLLILKRVGANRISIGMQSIHENELKYLGRIHTFGDFLECYNMVQDAGFDNVSVDLMYGIPHQTRDSFRKTLERVISLSPNHISVYALIIEPGTPFYDKRDILPVPNEDDEVEMYYDAARLLGAAGYCHYEISNYAKSGFECRHNLKYWQDKGFIGVGLSAYSYMDNVRYGNTKNLSEYLSEHYVKYRTEDKIDFESERFEYVMMNLRLSSGFSLSEYKSRFGSDFLADANGRLDKYLRCGLVIIEGDRIRLSEKGFYVSNTIISDIV